MKIINKYQKALHKLILTDMEFAKDFGVIVNYRYSKIACKEHLRHIKGNTIDGANSLRNYILCGLED